MSSRLKSARYVLWPHAGFVGWLLAVGCWGRRVGSPLGGHRPSHPRAVACGFVALEVYAWLRYTLITVEYRRYRREPRAAAAASQGALEAVYSCARTTRPRLCLRKPHLLSTAPTFREMVTQACISAPAPTCSSSFGSGRAREDDVQYLRVAWTLPPTCSCRPHAAPQRS